MTAIVGTFCPSPMGTLRLLANDEGLVAVYFPDHKAPRFADFVEQADHPVLRLAQAEFTDYFAGKRLSFSTPLAPTGTAFQQDVWRALRSIPLGTTTTYSAIATGLGKPSAVRAVGAANGRNPLSIIVPCHRVVGADGTLTGYAGGLPAKRWLLDHERGMLSGQRHSMRG